MSKSSKHMVNYVPSAVYITIRLQFNMASVMRYCAMCTKWMILRGTNGMRADLRCWQKNEKWKRNGVLLRRLLERSKEDTPGGNRFLCKNSKQALLLTSLTMRVFTFPDSLQVSGYHQSKKIISYYFHCTFIFIGTYVCILHVASFWICRGLLCCSENSGVKHREITLVHMPSAL
jgi:hypothetical protein